MTHQVSSTTLCLKETLLNALTSQLAILGTHDFEQKMFLSLTLNHLGYLPVFFMKLFDKPGANLRIRLLIGVVEINIGSGLSKIPGSNCTTAQFPRDSARFLRDHCPRALTFLLVLDVMDDLTQC